jgi:oligopeptidase A
MEPAENPLFQRQIVVPFPEIRAEHVRPAIADLLGRARSDVSVIVETNHARTYDGTLGALEQATELLEFAIGVVAHLEATATTPELRDAYDAVLPDVSTFFAGLPLDEGLWRALREYSTTDDARALRGARARFLEKTLDDFRRHGAELDVASKSRLQQIEVDLSRTTNRFGQNVLDSTTAFEIVIEDEAKLAGLPETALDAARQSAADAGKPGWRLTLQEPSVFAVMTYLDDANIRERIYRARNARATSGDLDNRPLVDQILALRRERARILGYAHHVDLVLEDRMAHEGARARDFVRTLRDRTLPFFSEENARLQAFRRELEGPAVPSLQPWDLAYYAEKQRRVLYDFDEEALRPYFAAQGVIAGMFEVARRLFGIAVEKTDELPTWDPSVRSYRMLDESGDLVGCFHLDLHPRENKRDGGWMDGLFSTPGSDPSLALVVANLSPPVGDRPALLTHHEVLTLFHEFGHLLHHLLSRVQVRSLAGTNVACDFVELPSQIMENWCWEREALDVFARHHETGEPIPEALFSSMRRARTYRAANAMMRQLGFAAVDLGLHMDYEPKRDGDVIAYSRAILQEHAPAPFPADHALVASFNHLFAAPVAYSGGYYSYKWAEVLDADAFSRFEQAGVFDREVGEAFRDRILARGDSEDPMELYKSFMGREPSLTPLLERSGLVR